MNVINLEHYSSGEEMQMKSDLKESNYISDRCGFI